MPRIKEKSVENYLVSETKRQKGHCIKLSGYVGIHDRLVILSGGRVGFCELKRPGGGRVSSAQRLWARRLQDLGFLTFVIRDRGDVDSAIAKIAQLPRECD